MKIVVWHIFILSSVFINPEAFSQAVRSPISSAYLGMGAYSNNHIDVFSIEANQAALARLTATTAGLYAEKKFLVKELGFYDAAFGFSTQSGNFALDTRYFGYTDFNEMQLGLAYARNLGNRIDVGVQFNYYTIRVAGYGSASTFTFDIGTILHLADKLNVGVHVYNPIKNSLGKNGEEKLASIYSTGIGLEPSEKFYASLEVVKEEDKPVNVNAGFQYKVLTQILARVGIASATSSMFLGIGCTWKGMRVDIITIYHQLLGITPGIMLLCTLHKKTA